MNVRRGYMNQDFFDLVDLFERKYFCEDLDFRFKDIKEESKQKRRFDHEELKFEEGQSKNLENGFIELPNFYEEPMNLPISGTKFIRSRVKYYQGDLAQIVCEIGYWRLKPHDLQHR